MSRKSKYMRQICGHVNVKSPLVMMTRGMIHNNKYAVKIENKAVNMHMRSKL